MRTKKIPILLIKKDPSLQPRARLDDEVIADYAAAHEAGVKLPPIDVYLIGREYYVTDGWHRLAAYQRCGVIDEVDCHVTTGTLPEAQWAALAANQTHGLRRTTADKERAVRAALRHPMATKKRLSDRTIAAHVGVDPKTVGKYRAEMQRGEEIPHVNARTGKDGKTYEVPDKPCEKPSSPVQVPKQISVPPGDLVRCPSCGRDVEPDADGACPECLEPELAVTVVPPQKPHAYIDQDGEMGQVVAVIRGLNDQWISARGRHRVKSPRLPPRPTWEQAQADLDKYAAERGWTEYKTDQPVAVERPAVAELGTPLASEPNWIVSVGALAYEAIEIEGRPAVAERLQRLVSEILMG